jgi:hypothetical protein
LNIFSGSAFSSVTGENRRNKKRLILTATMTTVISGADTDSKERILANNLPREVLKWIQSLDLSCSVKNVKRDFSNGFLVAEIIQRYYTKEISTHSYDNGMSAKGKRDNWAQLMKIFRKIGLSDVITENEAHWIATLEDGVACMFICKLYEALTKRKVTTVIKKPTVGREPGYSKDTSLAKVRKALAHNDLGEDSDIHTVSRVISEVVMEHERSLHEDRISDPERYSGASISQKSSLIPKNANEVDEEVPQVRVKEIQVKQLDRNITHLRASKQRLSPTTSKTNNSNIRSIAPSGNEHGGYNGGDGGYASPSGMEGESYGYSSPVKSGGVLADNSSAVINACIARIINPDNLDTWSMQLDPYQNYLQGVATLSSLPNSNNSDLDILLAQCCDEIKQSAVSLGDSCIITPKQFWKVSDLLSFTLMSTSYSSLVYNSAVNAFQALGKYLAYKDPSVSLPLFFDFGLLKLIETMKKNSLKRIGILTVLLAFAGPDPNARFQCISRLLQLLGDIIVFIHCLTITCAFEVHVDDRLLDIYRYYATMALTLPSPKMRSGAVLIISTLMPKNRPLFLTMMPDMMRLSKSESWWEIQCHLLSYAGTVLNSNDVDENDKSNALEIIQIIFSKNRSRNIVMWGLGALSKATNYCQSLVPLYVELLSGVSNEDRSYILGFETDGDSNVGTIPLPSASGIPLTVKTVIDSWSSLSIAKYIESTVTDSSNNIDRLSKESLQILHACVESMKLLNNNDNSDYLYAVWVDIYLSLKDYIFVGFSDGESGVSSAGILSCYMYGSKLKETILSESRFIGTLRLLYPSAVDTNSQSLVKSQNIMERFLRDVFMSGRPYDDAVFQLLTTFSKNYVANYEKYFSIQKLFKELSSSMR